MNFLMVFPLVDVIVKSELKSGTKPHSKFLCIDKGTLKGTESGNLGSDFLFDTLNQIPVVYSPIASSWFIQNSAGIFTVLDTIISQLRLP